MLLIPLPLSIFLAPEPSVVGEQIRTITREEFHGMTDGYLLIDARSEELMAAQSVEGAIPYLPAASDNVLASVLEVWKPGILLIVFCDDSQCGKSRIVAGFLVDSGLEEVAVLEGGWDTLKEEEE